MRGKFAQEPGAVPVHETASMRPAHYAREVGLAFAFLHVHSHASMRPAHYAREVFPSAVSSVSEIEASMRPAHYAREVLQWCPSRLAIVRLQ